MKKHKLMFILKIINVLQWAASEVLPSHNLSVGEDPWCCLLYLIQLLKSSCNSIFNAARVKNFNLVSSKTSAAKARRYGYGRRFPGQYILDIDTDPVRSGINADIKLSKFKVTSLV